MISYSQSFEDVMLWRALKNVRNGFYVDVGANSPVICSVTKWFYDQGWTGINIEPDERCFDELKTSRPNDINLLVAAGESNGQIDFFETKTCGWATTNERIAQKYLAPEEIRATKKIPCHTLEFILDKYAENREIHFLKIDVEGGETSCLKGMNFRKYRPWILVIEAVKPNTQELSVDWENLVINADYKFVYFDGVNRFYVCSEKYAALKDCFRDPPNPFDYYVLYDVVRLNDENGSIKRELETVRQKLERGNINMDNILKEYQSFFANLENKLAIIPKEKVTEIHKHLDYLAEKAGVTREHILSGGAVDVEPQILSDAVQNITNVLGEGVSQPAPSQNENLREMPVYLGRDLMLCRMRWGGYIVCPTWNVDVAVGLIRDGMHEEALTRFVMQNVRKGEAFVNVGANFGYYTVLGAKLVEADGCVYSFEANPIVFSVLLKTLYYSGFVDRIALYHRAVSDRDNEELELDFDYQFIGGGSIMYQNEIANVSSTYWNKDNICCMLDEFGKYRTGYGLYNKIRTKTISLDTALRDEIVDWILCDAESAEPLIMLGAQRLIKRSPKVRIIFEWGSRNYEGFGGMGEEYRTSVQNMWRFLEEEGFKIRYIFPTLQNGEPKLSNPLSFDTFVHHAEHGDYLASREG